MSKIRVLVVDDSVVIRRLVSDFLNSEPELEVVGVAANGRIALSKITQLQPEVVVMDVEMPELDGLATLAEIKKTHRSLPVIMFSTLTERGAGATLDALALGAVDYVTKPANVGSITEALNRVRLELVPKIKQFGGKGKKLGPTAPALTPMPRPAPVQPAARPIIAPGPSPRVDVVAIGVSTGGPDALLKLLPSFPEDFPVPIFAPSFINSGGLFLASVELFLFCFCFV